MSYLKLAIVVLSFALSFDCVKSDAAIAERDVGFPDAGGLLAILAAILQSFLQAGSSKRGGDSGHTKVNLTYHLSIDSNYGNVAEANVAPCEKKPCKYFGECTPEGDLNFSCKCQFPTSGKTCEEIQANCTVSEELELAICVLFFTPENAVGSGNEAKTSCQKQGYGEMFMPKTKVLNDFVSNYFKSEFYKGGDITKIDDYHMVGITNNGEKPLFFDGTAVDSFSDWVGGSPEIGDGECVSMSTKENLAWQFRSCYLSGYEICQVKIQRPN